MTARLEHLEADAPASDIVALLQRDGALIVDRLIDADAIARINAEVDPYVEAADPGMAHLNPAIGFFFGKETRHVAGMPGKSRTFATEVMIHPTLMAVCDAVLLPSCARYQLNLGHLIDKGPGGKRQLFHRDELVWVHVPRPHPEIQVATMIALEDFSEEIGATCIVPGSHTWPLDRQPEEHEVAVAEMAAGSAAIYLGSTIHAGGENRTSDRWRRGLHTSWICGWLRTNRDGCAALGQLLPISAMIFIGLPLLANEYPPSTNCNTAYPNSHVTQHQKNLIHFSPPPTC